MSRSHLIRLLLILLTLAILVGACAPAVTPTPASAPPKPAATVAPVPTQPPAAPATVAPAAAKPTTAPSSAPTAAAPAAKVPPPPATKPAKLDKVRLGVIQWNVWFWVPMIAEIKKLMEPYGIDLEIFLTRTVPAQAQALASGSVDFGGNTPTSVWALAEKAPEFKMFMTSVAGNGYTFIVQPEIKTFQDIKGKVIGANSQTIGGDVEMMRNVLAKNGLQFPKDYDIVVSGTVADRVNAMVANQYAGVAVTPPETFELLDRGKKPLAQGWDYPDLRDQIIGTIIGNQKWVAQPQNREVAIRFVQAYIAATAWLYDPKNRAEAVKILSDRTGMKLEWAERTYDQVVVQMKVYGLDPRVDPRKLDLTFAGAKAGGQSVPPDPMALVDNSLIEAALK